MVRLTLRATLVATALAAAVAAPVSAHPHVAEHSSHLQVLANGQNHPAFQPVNEDGLRLSCAGIMELPNTGPAGYGLETAHHGPDAGQPGKADGCYAVLGNPQDDSPGLD